VVQVPDHSHNYEDNTLGVGSPAAVAGGPTYPAGDNLRTTGGASWNANSFGTTGPRLYDGNVTADRTGNALAANDTAYFGNITDVSGPALAHNNMPPESFLNIMIKY
jgi:hypothetical protein